MLGVSLADAGLRRAFATPDAQLVIHHGALATALLTLGVAVGMTVFAPRAAKLFALLTGAVAGWVFAYVFGLVHVDMASELAKVSLVALPSLSLPSWRFDISLIPVVGLVLAMCLLTCSAPRSPLSAWMMPTGAGPTCAPPNGRDRERHRQHSRGLATGFPIATSSSAVGLAFATGATSRIIGVVAAPWSARRLLSQSHHGAEPDPLAGDRRHRSVHPPPS